jgi:hypothetical protein
MKILLYGELAIVPSGAPGTVGFFDSSGNGISADLKGRIYVSGSFDGLLTFGTTTLNSVNTTAPNAESAFFMATLLENGYWENAVQGIPLNNDTNTTQGYLVSNNQGDIFGTSSFSGQLQFGNNVVTSNTTIASNNDDIFLVDLVRDRLLDLIGISPTNAPVGGTITPIFDGTPSGNIYTGLVPSFEYYINSSGQLVPGCQSGESDPGLTYVGTSISPTELILQ